MNRLARLLTFCFFVSLQVAVAPADACNVPVFRYALERWRPDAYQAVVFHREPLSDVDRRTVDRLEQASDQIDNPCNVQVTVVDLAATPTKWLVELYDQQKATESPWLAILAPSLQGDHTTVWSAPLRQTPLERWLESPARRELSKRLMAGESVVWVYLNDGPLKADEPTYAGLNEALQGLEKEIELPDGIGESGSELFSQVPLKIKFSVLAVDRRDEAEQPFVTQLLRGDKKLIAEKGPIVFPVFGCGRVLDAISGEDLTSDIYGYAASYLCGACSCQVKEQNPGYDLMLATNWNKLLDEELAGELPRGSAGGLAARSTGVVATSDAEPVLVPIPGARRSPSTASSARSDVMNDASDSGLRGGAAIAAMLLAVSLVLTVRGWLS